MDKTADNNLSRPTIRCGDLTKPPAALRPLLVRPQWAIWRLTWSGKRWTKPPFQARDPQSHASSADSATWTDYATAVAAAVKHGDGVSYILTPEDDLAAADIDHVPPQELSPNGRSGCSTRQTAPILRSARPALACGSGAPQRALPCSANSISSMVLHSSCSGAPANR